MCQIDFNLYGMGLLKLSRVLFREPLPERHSGGAPAGWDCLSPTPPGAPPLEVSYEAPAGASLSQKGPSDGGGGVGSAGQGSGALPPLGSAGLAAAAAQWVWTRRTAPTSWRWAERGSRGSAGSGGGGGGSQGTAAALQPAPGCKAPTRTSTCELEADAVVADVLNRGEVRRRRRNRLGTAYVTGLVTKIMRS